MRLDDLFNSLFSDLVQAFRPPIGIFADITFDCSAARVLTYNKFKRMTRARYAKHDRLNNVGAIEFTGLDPAEISLSITLHRRLGIDVEEAINQFRRLCLGGVASNLILGNKVVGENLWVVESINETRRDTDYFGRVLIAELDLTFKEYVKGLT